jgi:KUP system potassium uptake protein
MMFWFATLGVLGLWNVIQHPACWRRSTPGTRCPSSSRHRAWRFLALGSVVLAITGGEALYADMGHFGRRAIKWAWFALVFPLLYLNYLGQGALILADPQAIDQPLLPAGPRRTAGSPAGRPGHAATVIASQAVISGAFSLTSQAMQLGYCPRIQVKFTSEREKGQIYVPNINWLLLLTVIVVVLGFRSSSNLASAYGIAVTLTMMIDTLLAFVVVRALWQWSWPRAALFLVFFVVVDFAFFSANVIKIVDGGWFPLALGTAVFVAPVDLAARPPAAYERLQTGFDAARRLHRQHCSRRAAARARHRRLSDLPSRRGAACTAAQPEPQQVLHERVVVLNVAVADVPHVAEAERVRVEALGQGFHRVHVAYGFKDEPDLPRALALCAADGLALDMMSTSFFLGRDTVVRLPPGQQARMANWRQTLFNWMFRNADTATEFFKLPPNRVVELGAQVELC